MMFYLVFSLSISFALGFILVSLCWQNLFPLSLNLLMKSSLAAGIGMGFSSTLFFLWLVLLSAHGDFLSFILTEISILLVLLALLFFVPPRNDSKVYQPISKSFPNPKLYLTLSICFYCTLIFMLISFLLISIIAPHGGWDAFVVWNLKARFLFRGTEHWKNVFSNLISWSRPDYPLLLPGIIASTWGYVGKDLTIVPAIVALLFILATLGLLSGSLSMFKSKGQGLLAGLVLLSTQHYILRGADQNADIPLSFFSWLLPSYSLFLTSNRSQMLTF